MYSVSLQLGPVEQQNVDFDLQRVHLVALAGEPSAGALPLDLWPVPPPYLGGGVGVVGAGAGTGAVVATASAASAAAAAAAAAAATPSWRDVTDDLFRSVDDTESPDTTSLRPMDRCVPSSDWFLGSV